MNKHLWQIKHPYYCTASEPQYDFNSWDEFLSQMIDADLDYNFLVRWDWHDSNNPDHELKRDELQLFFIYQRKGFMFTVFINVEKKDEKRIEQYLLERWLHLQDTWKGISDIPEVKEIE